MKFKKTGAVLWTRIISSYEITKLPLIINDHSPPVDFNRKESCCVVLWGNTNRRREGSSDGTLAATSSCVSKLAQPRTRRFRACDKDRSATKTRCGRYRRIKIQCRKWTKMLLKEAEEVKSPCLISSEYNQTMLSNTLHDSLIATNFPHASTLLDLQGFCLKGERKGMEWR
jgi:hypothetical protein